MLVMAIVATLSLSSLLILQFQDSPAFAQQNNPYVESANQCVIEDLIQAGPECKPRPVLVDLPVPYLSDGSIPEVIPNQVQVQRCQGVCHQSNTFHKCVPHEGGRVNKTVDVVLRNIIDNTLNCHSIVVEEHQRCKCGCDIEASACKSNQIYDHFYCKCRCKDEQNGRRNCLRKQREKFWEEETCRCICKPEKFRECSTGFVYDAIDTCQCVPLGLKNGNNPNSVTNLAGTKVLVPLILALVFCILIIVVLAYKLRQQLISQKNFKAEQQLDNEEQITLED